MKTQTHSNNTILPEMDAPDELRGDVAALCAAELAEYDASIEAGQ